MKQQSPPYASGSYTPASPVPATAEETAWAVAAHLISFFGYALGIGQYLAPLLILLTSGRSSEFVAHHAREALNYQLSITIYALFFVPMAFLGAFAATVLLETEAIVLVMFLLIPYIIVLCLFDLVVVCVAAAAAGRGALYRYPLTIRFVR